MVWARITKSLVMLRRIETLMGELEEWTEDGEEDLHDAVARVIQERAATITRLGADLKHAVEACETNRAAHDEVRAALDRVIIERDALALENQEASRERSAVHHKLIAAYNERDDMRAIRNQLAEVLDDVAKNLGVEAQALVEDPSLACPTSMRDAHYFDGEAK